MPLLLGIDNGLTVTKAVVFDLDGRVLATARRRIPQIMARPRHVERDMAALWVQTAAAIAEAVATCGKPAADIACVAATAHGDGLYLVDRDAQPLGHGILSLDSRAGQIVADWRADGIAERALALTGQVPHASAPSALLAWLRVHERDRYDKIWQVLTSKDWIRACLTGQIATDLTEASTSFTDVRTQSYSAEAGQLFGLPGLARMLPPILNPDDIAGHVTDAAAAATGLVAGTSVAAGLHDVTASALGAGGYGRGVIALVAGTYSINETVSDRPLLDRRWFCRNGLRRGEWNNMSISPASATNYDWFLDQFWQSERRAAEAGGRDIHDQISAEVEAALQRPSSVLFHPFLFGSPFGAKANGGVYGLRGWHERADILRAVVEGIAMNHRVHVDALRDGFGADTARLTGGMSRNPLFAQMFADTLAMPVSTCDTDEPAAWGAALCAGSAIGLFDSPRADPRDIPALTRQFRPDPDRSAQMQRRYALFHELAEAMVPIWPKLEALALIDD